MSSSISWCESALTGKDEGLFLNESTGNNVAGILNCEAGKVIQVVADLIAVHSFEEEFFVILQDDENQK